MKRLRYEKCLLGYVDGLLLTQQTITLLVSDRPPLLTSRSASGVIMLPGKEAEASLVSLFGPDQPKQPKKDKRVKKNKKPRNQQLQDDDSSACSMKEAKKSTEKVCVLLLLLLAM